MSIIKLKPLIKKAHKQNYAIAGFNVLNLETLKGVVLAGELTQIPIVIQISQSAIKWAGYEYLIPMVKAVLKKSSGKFILHLDHCDNLKLFKKAIVDGFGSVMFDGSHFSFEQNVKLSQKAKQIALVNNVCLELEIGKVGGKENDQIDNFNSTLDINDIKKFYDQTKPDMLAIAFGTAHGIYQKAVSLDFKLVKATKKLLQIPLVMHGTSGIEYNDIIKSVKSGINKVNIATDLLVVFNQATRKYLKNNPTAYDVRKINALGIEAIKNKAIEYLLLFSKK